MRAPPQPFSKPKCRRGGEKMECKPDNFDHTIDEGKIYSQKKKKKLFLFSILQARIPFSDLPPTPLSLFTFAILLCHRDFSVCDGFGV
jgi:hypothetical protein